MHYLVPYLPARSDLHKGILTTSSLKEVLGFCEPAAAKRLDIPRGFVSHDASIYAYRKLLHPMAHLPSIQPHMTLEEVGASARGNMAGAPCH